MIGSKYLEVPEYKLVVPQNNNMNMSTTLDMYLKHDHNRDYQERDNYTIQTIVQLCYVNNAPPSLRVRPIFST